VGNVITRAFIIFVRKEITVPSLRDERIFRKVLLKMGKRKWFILMRVEKGLI
jgi:hypothetical protein